DRLDAGPSLLVSRNPPAPGQRLEADAQSSRASQIRKRAEVAHVSFEIRPAARIRRRAHEQRIGAEVDHLLEQLFRLCEPLGSRSISALVVSQQLESRYLQAGFAQQRSHAACAAVSIGEVPAPYFEPVESRGSNGGHDRGKGRAERAR